MATVMKSCRTRRVLSSFAVTQQRSSGLVQSHLFIVQTVLFPARAVHDENQVRLCAAKASGQRSCRTLHDPELHSCMYIISFGSTLTYRPSDLGLVLRHDDRVVRVTIDMSRTRMCRISLTTSHKSIKRRR